MATPAIRVSPDKLEWTGATIHSPPMPPDGSRARCQICAVHLLRGLLLPCDMIVLSMLQPLLANASARS